MVLLGLVIVIMVMGLTQEETWQNKTHEQVHVAQREAAARDTFSTADG